MRALRPRVFVIMAWDSAHPTVNTLAAMYSKAIYPGERDVVATAVKPERRSPINGWATSKARTAHVVIRVEDGGGELSGDGGEQCG